MNRFCTLTIVIAIALAPVGCGKGKPEPVDPTKRPVRTLVLEPSGGSQARDFSGVVRASAELRLGFSQGGKVARVDVKVGDVVVEGQVLAVLDTRAVTAQLAEANAAVRQASAQLKGAKRRQETLASLLASGGTSRLEYETAAANVEGALAAVNSSQQKVRQLKAAAQDTELKAPKAGTVAAVPVDAGEVVGGGSPVVVLNTGGLPEVAVSIPASVLTQVNVGASVSVSAATPGDKARSGKVFEKGVSPTSGGATYDVLVRLDSADPSLHVGMAVTASVVLETGSAPAILLPTTAIAADADGEYALVIEGSGDAATAKRRAITLGAVRSDGVVVASGLGAGDRVVTAGMHSIEDGEAVVLDKP
jgi:RND family efflux transporter MFP subunit